MWKNIVEQDRPQMTIWHMRIACWISKATNIHSEYVILFAFHGNNGCMNTPQCYVRRTLPVYLRFCHWNAICIYHECQMHHPSHLSCIDARMIVGKKYGSWSSIIQSFPDFCSFLSLSSTYSLQHPVLKHLQPVLYLMLKRPKFYTHIQQWTKSEVPVF
jgi:hypothetical protein